MTTFRKCDNGCDLHEIHDMWNNPRDVFGNPIDTNGAVILTCISEVANEGRSVGFHRCARKLASNTEFPHLCGMHIAAIKRSRSKSEQRDTLKAARKALTEHENARLVALNEKLGIHSVLEMRYPRIGPERFIGAPSGRVILDISELEKLADRITALHAALDDELFG